LGVDRYADNTTGHGALELVARGEEGGMRPTIAHGNTETLRRANRNISAEFARRRQYGECEKIGRHDGNRSGAMELVDHTTPIADLPRRARIRQQRTTDFIRFEPGRRIANHQVEAESMGAGFDHAERLGMRVTI